MTRGFGRRQAQQPGIGAIIIALETNSRASSPLHVYLHCVLHRFTKWKHIQYIIEHCGKCLADNTVVSDNIKNSQIQDLWATSGPVSPQILTLDIDIDSKLQPLFMQFVNIICFHITSHLRKERLLTDIFLEVFVSIAQSERHAQSRVNAVKHIETLTNFGKKCIF